MNDPVWNHVRKNPDTVPASQHKQSFQTVCFGPFISPGVYKDHVFDVNIKILLGEEVCSQALGQGVWSSRLVEPVAASVSKERFACFPLRPRKLCGIQVIYVSFVAYL